MSNLRQLTNLVWSIADLLRGEIKPSDYASVLIPFTALRRLESVRGVGGATLADLTTRPPVTTQALSDYVDTFPSDVRAALEHSGFLSRIRRLDKGPVLHQIVARVAEIDLRHETVSNGEMGYVFDDLMRSLVARSDELGEYSTPLDVARLAVQLLLAPDISQLAKTRSPLTAMDPACGVGGMLSELVEQVATIDPAVDLRLSGQEINNESWALCRLRMLVEGHEASGIELGDALSDDRHADEQFDYLIAVPPFGVAWKGAENSVRREHEELGMAGRFGAGLPRTSDGSLLFLQHMLSKMKPTGSRVVVLFNESAMRAGSAGSGESDIRQWIIENDWLECVLALPDSMMHNTAIPTYLWMLTNRKPAGQRGKVVLVDARGQSEQMRKPLGSKRRYFTNEQIKLLVETCLDSTRAQSNSDHPLHQRVWVVDNDDFGYQQVLIEQPLRLRFELTDAALDVLAKSGPARDIDDLEELLAPLKGMIGSVWTDKQSALADIETKVLDAGRQWPMNPAFRRAVVNAMGVPHQEGAVQQNRGVTLPDTDQRRWVRLPLDADIDEYLRQKVLPYTPDAWIEKSRVGFEISPMRFFTSTLDTRFVPLREVADIRPAERIAGADSMRHLRMQDMYSVDSAEMLQEVPENDRFMTGCAGGDLVGGPRRWWLLPPEFGEAATFLTVLRPRQPYGRVLCEWLNSLNDHAALSSAWRRPPDDLPVPIDLIADDLLDGLLQDVHESQKVVREALSNVLPNVFSETKRDTRYFRENARSIAVQAALVGEVMKEVVDPVWQAEWSYPFHVAALARRYRLSSQPAERKDALLKLGEGVARTVGILALSESIDRDRLPDNLASWLKKGATFGTWINVVHRFSRSTAPLRMRELTELRDDPRLVELLRAIKDARDDSSHAHGVRAAHQLERQVEVLQPLVMSALTAANWLSTVPWDWIQRCEYLDESSYRLIGQRLRGSHPHWEPFERSSTYSLRPGRVYTGTDTTTGTRQPVDLTPLADVQVCPACRAHELFLINEVDGNDITLRSLEEHVVGITQSPTPVENGG